MPSDPSSPRIVRVALPVVNEHRTSSGLGIRRDVHAGVRLTPRHRHVLKRVPRRLRGESSRLAERSVPVPAAST